MGYFTLNLQNGAVNYRARYYPETESFGGALPERNRFANIQEMNIVSREAAIAHARDFAKLLSGELPSISLPSGLLTSEPEPGVKL